MQKRIATIFICTSMSVDNMHYIMYVVYTSAPGVHSIEHMLPSVKKDFRNRPPKWHRADLTMTP